MFVGVAVGQGQAYRVVLAPLHLPARDRCDNGYTKHRDRTSTKPKPYTGISWSAGKRGLNPLPKKSHIVRLQGNNQTIEQRDEGETLFCGARGNPLRKKGP